MVWAILLAQLFRAAVVLTVFGFTSWLVFFLGFSGWWFLMALVVCAAAFGGGDE